MTLENIGEGDDALLCKTNLTICCIRPYTENWFALGDWWFPNGTEVPMARFPNGTRVLRYFGAMLDFYTTRGQMVVGLNRRRGGVEGIYHCEIPNSVNIIQTLYIGVYTAGTGK